MGHTRGCIAGDIDPECECEMTGYSRTWDCALCLEPQETIDQPRVMACDKCIEPLAAKLCREEMAPVKRSDGVDIWDHPAIDHGYFRERARDVCAMLLRRRYHPSL